MQEVLVNVPLRGTEELEELGRELDRIAGPLAMAIMVLELAQEAPWSG